MKPVGKETNKGKKIWSDWRLPWLWGGGEVLKVYREWIIWNYYETSWELCNRKLDYENAQLISSLLQTNYIADDSE